MKEMMKQYKQESSRFRTLRKGSLHIFGFKGTPRELVIRLVEVNQERLKHHFTNVVIHSEDLPLPKGSYMASRQQYKAMLFLDMLQSQMRGSIHALGLVNLDLFVPQLNFIFGSAQFGGNAIVALPRLRQSFYGLPDDDALFSQRIEKEVFHELGHMLGLQHCANNCVMLFSNSLRDTDNKPSDYCPDCLSRLE
jgi:archaemetzincin